MLREVGMAPLQEKLRCQGDELQDGAFRELPEGHPMMLANLIHCEGTTKMSVIRLRLRGTKLPKEGDQVPLALHGRPHHAHQVFAGLHLLPQQRHVATADQGRPFLRRDTIVPPLDQQRTDLYALLELLHEVSMLLRLDKVGDRLSAHLPYGYCLLLHGLLHVGLEVRGQVPVLDTYPLLVNVLATLRLRGQEVSHVRLDDGHALYGPAHGVLHAGPLAKLEE
mmetsp:Transcript_36896/g.80931  ORF Transcript_36896/g.80931 Transcript_36896/m.80931 type:complete len:223 (+) Transcript_36896:470-1138(+)